MIFAYQHGIYPRSEALVAATRDLDRGRTGPEAVEAQFRADLQELVRLQQQANLDYLSDGLLRWQDLFRPLVEAHPGLTPGPLVRWFDNNTFYRAPVVSGELAPDGGLPPRYRTAGELPEPRVATLPSPLVFARVTRAQAGSGAQVGMEELASAVLRPTARALLEGGFQILHLQEPWLAVHGLEAGEWPAFERSLAAITEGLGATTVLHTYFGDAGRWAERLRQLPVDVVGFDFMETDVESLGPGWSKPLLAGCLNGRNSLVESVEAVVEFVHRLAEALQPPAIYLSSNSDLELLPEEVARRKVLRLGEAARRLREDLG